MTTRKMPLEKYRLKKVLREGWKRLPSITKIESVADHSWNLSLLVLEFTPKELDLAKCLALAIVHDIPEVIVGDITPHDGIGKEEKNAREQLAAQKLLPKHLHPFWTEYADASTPESKWVHLLDKIEMGIQAILYREEYGADTTEFLESTQRGIQFYCKHQDLPINLQIFLTDIGIS
jgi:putative hydrolases of HD superfamily